jgi:cytochrome c oxidase assembly protein subunit 15
LIMKLLSRRRFIRFGWFVLAYNLAVIVWGALVRASGSGAGCGGHWPLCQGVVFPHAAQIATLIELAHRMSSGVDFVLVATMAILAFRLFPAGHSVRRFAAGAFIFTLSEALVGAGLVLAGLVANNATLLRGAVLAIHLANTFALLACLALTPYAAGKVETGQPTAPGDGFHLEWQYGLALAAILVLAMTGSVAALGDTLFHARTLAQGMSSDFASHANPFLRLRILHPILAVLAGGYVLVFAVQRSGAQGSHAVRRFSNAVLVLIVAQSFAGVLNLLLLAPVWLQLLHLLLADLLWITLILLSAETFGWASSRLIQQVHQGTQHVAGGFLAR